jgi:hypothetical protein
MKWSFVAFFLLVSTLAGACGDDGGAVGAGDGWGLPTGKSCSKKDCPSASELGFNSDYSTVECDSDEKCRVYLQDPAQCLNKATVAVPSSACSSKKATCKGGTNWECVK